MHHKPFSSCGQTPEGDPAHPQLRPPAGDPAPPGAGPTAWCASASWVSRAPKLAGAGRSAPSHTCTPGLFSGRRGRAVGGPGSAGRRCRLSSCVQARWGSHPSAPRCLLPTGASAGGKRPRDLPDPFLCCLPSPPNGQAQTAPWGPCKPSPSPAPPLQAPSAALGVTAKPPAPGLPPLLGPFCRLPRCLGRPSFQDCGQSAACAPNVLREEPAPTAPRWSLSPWPLLRLRRTVLNPCRGGVCRREPHPLLVPLRHPACRVPAYGRPGCLDGSGSADIWGRLALCWGLVPRTAGCHQPPWPLPARCL